MARLVALLVSYGTPGKRLTRDIGIHLRGVARRADGNTAAPNHRDVRLQPERTDSGEHRKHHDPERDRADDGQGTVSTGGNHAAIARIREVGVGSS
ncbi:hypothetical protein ETB97_008907 [Aspergillus alliaceus]|uniref:Uncharacterized protein n=1 Tax=Petromyces alliaceus TaxID=209559 RepID=A0A8H6E910_PETAA|nr:hypothetical protein ETB97_008907 [Aspergillus burnettii]